MLDIKKLGGGKPPGGGSIIDPRRIFGTLARDPRFRRPSDEQGEVLDKWFAVRTQVDNTLKMNTGAGKTLVGLLAMQSSLNEGVGPAVYVTPDVYLAKQVMKEAKDLGISVTDDPRSATYVSGKSILVINVYKFINGKSVFGVGSEGSKIPIGALVIDDAHACLAVVADQ
jgi:replicative superfamily II helicase